MPRRPLKKYLHIPSFLPSLLCAGEGRGDSRGGGQREFAVSHLQRGGPGAWPGLPPIGDGGQRQGHLLPLCHTGIRSQSR